MTKYLIIMVLIALTAVYVIEQDDSMEVCQQTHSKEVCFNQLRSM